MEDFRKTMGLRRRVLVVDDEMVNREILGNILENDYEVSFAENGRQAYEMLLECGSHVSLVLLDLLMPEMDGFELLQLMNSNDDLNNIPVIVMTSEESAEVRSIKLGASDFITKPYDMPEVILARCERIIELYENKSIIRSAEKDDLTGLYTREFFFEYIRKIENFFEDHASDAIVLNIEHFHMINEMYGREVGDAVLRRTGLTMMDLFESQECIGCRTEADTFFFYVDHRDDYTGAFDGLHEELAQISKMPNIRFRIGIYQNVDKHASPEVCFDHAKIACDRIRGDYTRRVAYYSKELSDRELYHERLINDINAGIENKDFVVYFQPKYAIQGVEPRLTSAEALIRWNHPELGMISPGDFIPLFESNGLIQKVDNYVWSEAARQIKAWKEEYDYEIPVSVNVSRIDIYDPELESNLLSILEENGLTPDDLLLEITESAYSENGNSLIEVVESLREKGFKIEMDDFGSGYSSLNMITTIPIDVLKMDMKFIRNMLKDEKSLKLVGLVMDIAKFLNVPVVAEGVEDEKQLITLKDIGCDIIQGYYFSRPVPPAEFAEFLLTEKEKKKKSEEEELRKNRERIEKEYR